MVNTLRKDAVFDKCPECKSIGVLRRSRGQNFYENLVKKTGFLNLYRCRECGWRGIKSNFSLRKISYKVVLGYIAMILMVAYLVRFIILRFIMK